MRGWERSRRRHSDEPAWGRSVTTNASNGGRRTMSPYECSGTFKENEVRSSTRASVEEEEYDRHQPRRTVNTSGCVNRKTEHVGQEIEMTAGEKWDHVGERQVPGFQGGHSKGQTGDVECDIDQLDQNSAPSPRTHVSMTVNQVWISQVFGCQQGDLFPESRRVWKKIDQKEDKEKAARGRSIYLGDIHGNAREWGTAKVM